MCGGGGGACCKEGGVSKELHGKVRVEENDGVAGGGGGGRVHVLFIASDVREEKKVLL